MPSSSWRSASVGERSPARVTTQRSTSARDPTSFRCTTRERGTPRGAFLEALKGFPVAPLGEVTAEPYLRITRGAKVMLREPLHELEKAFVRPLYDLYGD